MARSRSLLRRFLKRFAAKPQLKGLIEQFDATGFRGWLIQQATGPRRFVVRIDDSVEHEVITTTEQRDDVAEVHGEQHLHAGVRCEFSVGVAESVAEALRAGRKLRVRCNGVTLPILTVRKPGASLARERIALRATGSAPVHAAEWGHFALHGILAGRNVRIECTANGRPLDCGIATWAAGVDGEGWKFQLELPGYLWQYADAERGVRIELSADGEALLENPLWLDRARCAGWIADIAALPDGPERQYRGLLAIEHLRFGDLWSALDESARNFVHELAKNMHLEEYAEGDHTGDTPVDAGESASERIEWIAIRALNARMAEGPGSVFARVRAVHDELRLVGAPRQRYLTTTIPLLCRSGELEQMRSLFEFAPFYTRELSGSAWESTVALALLAADGLFERVAVLLRSVAKHRSPDWLNTECIAWAMERAREREAAGALEQVRADEIHEAFLELLDDLAGGWFSRLFDADLIRVVVAMLDAGARHSDVRRRATIDAAIRHYGLCPEFWKQLAASGASAGSIELELAQASFGELQALIEGRGANGDERIRAARVALEIFRQKTNPEVATYERELLADEIAAGSGELSEAGCRLAEALQLRHGGESLRVAAFPTLSIQSLDRVRGTKERIVAGVRRVTERRLSPTYGAQHAAHEALRAMLDELPALDAEHAAKRLDTLQEHAFALANGPAGWLGGDMLAQIHRIAVQRGLASGHYLMHLGDVVKRALLDPATGAIVPAAVATALAALQRVQDRALAEPLLAEFRHLVRKRFGVLHEALFQQPSRHASLACRDGWFGDTLVVVYSCRKYLDTRVQAIRDTWLQDLQQRGIAHVVVVGGGKGTLEGDVLELDVSDRYEHLPQKSLALYEWIRDNTDFQYVLKIDDDCYLDVERYFGTLSYRKHHYYGRVIVRGAGDTDRLWHQPKSQATRARSAMDKSPEPSTYADGGGAYCLSRFAIDRLLRMRATEAGALLVGASFMEDKLVGDLLALGGIALSNEDYESCQRRRTFAEATPVCMWENGFFAGPLTPTMVVHLDTERDQHMAHALSRRAELWPKKVWPTYADVAMRGWSCQLELLSAPPQLARMRQEEVAVVAVMRNERIMAPHFLAHYRRLGVGSFVIVDNCSDDGTREYLLGEPDVTLFSADCDYSYARFGVAWQQAVLGNFFLGRWVVLVDADELLVYPDSEHRPLADFVAEIEADGADTVLTWLIDMYPWGKLAEADFARMDPFTAAAWFEREPLVEWRLGRGFYGNATHYLSALRHRLSPSAEPHAFTAQKKALLKYKPWMRFSQGLHDVANARVSSRAAVLAHFKYHAAFEEKVRVEVRRKQHFNNAGEYRRYASMLAELRGGFGSEKLSRKYTGSASFGEAGLFGTANGKGNAAQIRVAG